MVPHAIAQIQKHKTKQWLLNHQKANSYIDVLVQILLRSFYERIVLAQNKNSKQPANSYMYYED